MTNLNIALIVVCVAIIVNWYSLRKDFKVVRQQCDHLLNILEEHHNTCTLCRNGPTHNKENLLTKTPVHEYSHQDDTKQNI